MFWLPSFSDVPGTLSSLMLGDYNLKWQITSVCWLYSMHSLSYSFVKYSTSLLYLPCYHMLNYCVPLPLIEIHTKSLVRKRP